MNWFKRNKKTETRGLIGALNYNIIGGGYNTDKSMLLSTVYRCVDVISDSVALLPIETYYTDNKGFKSKYTNHPAYYILNKEPNSRMSRFTFMKTMVISMLLKGNAYAYIDRDLKGDVRGLYFINPDLVTITANPLIGGDIGYFIAGIKGKVEDCNIIHLINFSYDGINGISTISNARNTLGLATDSEAHASGFFKGGANLAGILKVESPLTTEQKQNLRSSWLTAFTPNTGTPNGVAVLEGNMNFQPITVNPSDAQLLETRKFNVIDICRFFGVSPVKAFDLSNSSYNTVEATQLSFLTDTLSPLLEKIESELERKIFKPSEKQNIDVRFDTSVLLRTDKASLADYYSKLVMIGAITPNEIRKQLDLPTIEDGDNAFIQVNLQTLKLASNQTTEEVNKQIDNLAISNKLDDTKISENE